MFDVRRALVALAVLAGVLVVGPVLLAGLADGSGPAAALAADPTPTPTPDPTPTPTPTAPPLTVVLQQHAAAYDAATNKETVTVDLVVGAAVAPLAYEVAVRGVVKATGSSDVSPITLSLVNDCSITTQSVTAVITDGTGATVAAADVLDHSLCPPPPDVPHAQDRILAGPTLTSASFADHLRAMGSPTLRKAAAIYDTLLAGGVNPAFALGTFQAESHSGTRGYAVITKNWGNILYRPWTAAYGAVPYAPGNGYTYAMFPTWLASVRAYVDLVRRYDAGGYVTVSKASAHWLGTTEGSTRHLRYLKNIVTTMTLLPDDAVPVMVSLTAPAKAPGTFTASWTARDNLLVTGYQVKVRQGADPWLPTETLTVASRTFTLTDGTWTVAVRATDTAGNWSRWKLVPVAVDATAPVMGPLVAPHVVRTAHGDIAATWSGSDNVAVSAYEIRWRKGLAGAWSAVATRISPSLATRLGAGAWYLSIRARDAVGNVSDWREALVIVPTDDRLYRFSSGGVLATGKHYFRGTLTTTARRAASMTVTFTGSSFHLVGTAGPSFGRMTVSIDGVKTVVDAGRWNGARATRVHHRVLLFSRSLAPGVHTVVITNLATSGRPWIGIDGIGVGP